MEILPVLVRETGSSIRRGQWVGLGVILRGRVREVANLIRRDPEVVKAEVPVLVKKDFSRLAPGWMSAKVRK